MSAARDMSSTFTRSVTASVEVAYRFVDGYHIFTSKDVRGLYVASKDARKAYERVALVMKDLVDLKVGMPCEISPSMSFDEWLETETDTVQSRFPETPLALGNKRYLIREAA